jgi:L-amino acid N-acyltransferase YncA
LTIRPANPADRAAIWQILRPVFRAGDTYAIEPDISEADALAYWFAPGNEVFLHEDGGAVLGTYLLRPNARGGGGHVCNAAYVTAEAARGRGVARRMLAHSLDTARARGYRAMQYNFVVATNRRAIETWQRAGFEVVGRLPGAFAHPREGHVDALVMYRDLTGAA